ncbi:roadblock/LC7 domain-containing protein [Streptomyces sp. NPDC051940]|uniref:roadblock/LC7 domain-containing protein n=1 Tax=Streptomyces sp. NPDC051940 TaxID=3155675 RepID=UPI003436EF19
MNPDLSWVLDDVLQVRGARHAILVSADGLLLERASAQSPDVAELGRDDAETHAAAMSSMQSLSRAVAPFVSAGQGQWKQTLIEYDGGWIFLIAAGRGAYLAASTALDVDMEAMSFSMQRQVAALGKAMTTPPRQNAGSGA